MTGASLATKHIPILAPEILDSLIVPLETNPPQQESWILDCTLGGGGHFGMLLSRVVNNPYLGEVNLLAIDQDPAAVARAEHRFASEISMGRVRICRARISEVSELIAPLRVVSILADLGFSSDQMDDPSRGLSFLSTGPLDMRLDPTRGTSVRDLLRTVTEPELARILHEYGEERLSRKIASWVIQARREKNLPETPAELAELIFRAYPVRDRHGRIHPATRSFQALRIAVNQEMDELDSLLDRVILNLQPKGRVAILSFHSLEDRKVKQVFKAKDSLFRQISKKPIEPSEDEIRRNPRSRSAKLRIAERVE